MVDGPSATESVVCCLGVHHIRTYVLQELGVKLLAQFLTLYDITVYTNTFLATLNSRNTVREIPNQCSSVSIPLSNIASDGSTVRSNNESGRVSRGHLGITRKTRYCTNGEVVDIVDLKPESTYTSENASDKVTDLPVAIRPVLLAPQSYVDRLLLPSPPALKDLYPERV
ncbi:hypothetical protein PHLCEN_2v12125 [Hermanssonia centrifuga]|uniref:Uncharacterized protein n=1 Tax=Hermanssonia centrifuga TaxID=98765 RepID=A0A2R6NHP8_9APHY|nr:hypothetical protein PHLCEN_2v12125 [Hermanssonia centrifuga]